MRTVTTLADTTPPTVPAGLVATAVTINSLTLSWTASTDNVGVTAYEVFRGSVSLGTTPATTFNLTGLAPNTGYSLRVRARDAAGKWSAQSTALVVRTLPDTTPPAVPTGLARTGATVTTITLAWAAAADDVATTAYEVFRNGVSLGTSVALTKTVTGLTPDTAYTFTVRARDAAANWSEPSAPLTVSTLPDTTAPTVPAGLIADVVNVSSFTLKWTAATDDVRVTGYEVFKDGVSLGLATAVSRNITGLTPATAYIFTVRARDAAGNWSAQSAALAVKTLADTTPPAVPTGLAASALTNSGFTLRWNVPTDNVHVTGYEVFKDGVSLGTTTTATKTLTGLYPATEYAMTVRARDAAGNWSAPSLPLPVTTLADTVAPTVPAGLTATAITVTGCTLSWTASTDAVGVTLYEVSQDGVVLGTTAATTLKVAGLTPNTTYAFKVRASDAAGNWSAPTASLAVKTLADTAAPSVPDGLAAGAITGTAFTLTWNPATDNVGVTAYEVFRGTVSLGTIDTTTLVINGLALGSVTTVKVRARDAAGNWSALSAALTVTTATDTTPPTVPAGLAAVDLGFTGFTLTWTASTDDTAVTAYEIFKDGVALGTSAVPSFAVTGLALNSTVTMTVRARDAAGNASALSAPLTVTTARDTTAPSGPTNVAATLLTPTGFTLNWTAAVDDVGVTAYEVFVNGVSQGVVTAPATTFAVTSLPPGGPSYVVTVRARDAAGNWSTAGDPLTVTINLVPFFTGFEAADGYVPGSLHGQKGWSVDGAAAIVATPVFRGAQAVEVAPAANLSLVTRQFANTNPGVTFVDFYARPAVADNPDAGTFFETDVAAVALTGLAGTDPVGTLQVFDGDGAQGGGWVSTDTGPAVALATGQVTAWQRITIRTDYVAKRWDLYLNGRMIAADLGFLENSAASFTSLSLNGHPTLTTGFDDVFVGFDNPLFIDADKDGLEDAWETAHGLNPAVNDRNADLDGDGVSNLREYLAGTGPEIPNTATDTDGDGLPDAWENQYFGTLRYGADADPGGVGRTLLQSYRLGLSPLLVPFTPSGLRLWLRADVGVQADAAGYVSTWSDLSGLRKDAAQTDPAARPRLVSNAANGKPVVRFDGVANRLDLPAFMAGAAAGELFVIVKVPGFANRYDGLWALGGSDGALTELRDGIKTFTEDFGRSTREPTGAPVVAPTDYIVYNISADATTWTLRLNGTVQSAVAQSGLAFSSNPVLGRGAANYYLQGDIAEVVAYDRVLGSVERTALQSYLGSKYGIAAPPQPPTLGAVVKGADSIAVSWTLTPADAPATTTIERQQGSGAFVVIANASTATALTDSGLVAGATYTYRAKSANVAGTSAYSAAVTVTLPAAATGVPANGQRLWLRADLGVTADNSGFVATWADQSAAQKNAAQTDPAARPRLVPNAANGQPVVRFDGTGRLDLPAFMSGAAAGELFVIVKVPGFANRYDGLWTLGGADGSLTELRNGIKTFTEDFGRSTREPTGVPVVSATDYIVYNISADATTWTLRLNGTVQSAVAQSGLAFSSNPVLGRGAANYYLQGDIAEIVAYDRVLGATERTALQSYLLGKYGIAAPPTLTATVATATSVALAWTLTPADATATTTVERQQGNGAFAVIATASTATALTDSGLVAGATYTYRAKSTNTAGTSTYSAAVTVSLPAAATGVPANGQRLWLRADVGVATDANGAISTWTDQSAAQKNAAQTDPAARPRLVPNAANGQPVVRFDGVANRLDLPAFMSGATAGELFVIVKIPGFATRYDGPWSLGGADGALTELRDGIKTFTEDFGRSTREPTGAPVVPATDYIVYNISADTTTWTLRLNGTVQSAVAQSGLAFSSSPVLGRGAANYYLQGDIAEVVAYDRVLTTAERTALQSYLGSKYGVISPPAAPTLTATVATATSVALTWTVTPTDATATTTVERQQGSGAFVIIANASTASALTDTGLVAGATYTYRAKSANAAGTSSYSSSVTVSLPAAATGVPANGQRLWLRADLGVMADSSGFVATWADQSGAQKNAAQTDPAARPRLVPNAANGQPVVRFDGTGRLDLPAFMSGASAGELFVIVKIPGFATRYDGPWSLGGADGALTELRDGIKTFTEDFGRSTREPTGAPVVPATDYIVYNISADTTTWTLRLNGTVQSAVAQSGLAFSSSPVLGRGAANYYLQGDIAEVVAYDRVLTAAERTALQSYLGSKYGIATPPAAPALNATVATATSVALGWTLTSAGATATTTVERQQGSGAFVVIANASASSALTDTGLIAGATYTYRAKSANAAGTSAYSTAVTVTLPAAATGVPANGQRLWLRADVGVATDANGSVSTWADQSAAQKNAAQTDPAARPRLLANAANGQPVVRFDGVASRLDLPAFMTGATAGELFVIVKIPGFAARYDGPWSLGGADGALTELRDGIKTFTEDFGRSTREPTGAPVVAPTDYIVYNISADAATWTLRLNGTVQSAVAQSGLAFSSSPVLGRGAANYYLQGDIAEIVAYDRVLGATERTALQSFLLGKYGIAVLPAAPTLDAVVKAADSVALAWTLTPADATATTTIERQQGSGPFVVITNASPASALIDSGLVAGATYTYRAKSANTAGTSAYSASVSVTLPAAATGVPANGQRLWLRADLGVQTDANGAVSTWADQSVAQKNAAQTDPSARPRLVSNAVNGQPVLRFDGNGRYLELPSFMTGASTGELFVIVKVPGFGNRLDGLWTLGGADGALIETRDGVPTFTEDFGNTQRLPTNAPLASPTEYLLYNVTARDGDWSLRLNGGLQFSTVVGVVAFNAAPKLGLGASGLFLQGDIAEVLAYDRPLSATERIRLGRYLGSKFGIAALLADVSAPSAPTGVTVSDLRSRSAVLTWNPSVDDVAVSAYTVFANGDLIGRTTGPSLLVTTLAPGSSYVITITAEDAAGNKSNSSRPLIFNTPESITAPGDLRAMNLSPTAFMLAWSSSSGPVVAYDIFRNGILVGSTTALSFAVAGLSPVQGFTLGVSARDAAGNSVPASPPFVVDLATLDLSAVNDGIPDRWKLAFGLSTTDASVAGADTDGDGKTNLEEYLAGTDPSDYFDGAVPVLTWLGSPTELDPDDALSVTVTDSLGKLLVNAPVVFTATNRSHLLRLGAGEPAMRQVIVRTNLRGVAKVFLVPGAQ